jgi:hypothetical protein
MLFQNWLSQATGEAVATSCKDIKILDFLGMELSYTMILKENKFHYSPLNPFFFLILDPLFICVGELFMLPSREICREEKTNVDLYVSYLKNKFGFIYKEIVLIFAFSIYCREKFNLFPLFICLSITSMIDNGRQDP